MKMWLINNCELLQVMQISTSSYGSGDKLDNKHFKNVYLVNHCVIHNITMYPI